MKIYKVILDGYEYHEYYYRSKEKALAVFQRELNNVKSDPAINFRQLGPDYFYYYSDEYECPTSVRFKEIDDSEFFSD
jgi:hypothetical protein